jgi:hypothetical protein
VLNKRTLIIISAIIGCALLIGTTLAATSARSWWMKKNLKTYVDRLEEGGFTIQMQPFHATQTSVTLCSSLDDFLTLATANGVTCVFADPDKGLLYFELQESGGTAVRWAVLSSGPLVIA